MVSEGDAVSSKDIGEGIVPGTVAEFSVSFASDLAPGLPSGLTSDLRADFEFRFHELKVAVELGLRTPAGTDLESVFVSSFVSGSAANFAVGVGTEG